MAFERISKGPDNSILTPTDISKSSAEILVWSNFSQIKNKLNCLYCVIIKNEKITVCNNFNFFGGFFWMFMEGIGKNGFKWFQWKLPLFWSNDWFLKLWQTFTKHKGMVYLRETRLLIISVWRLSLALEGSKLQKDLRPSD